jgi:hypothetical protein
LTPEDGEIAIGAERGAILRVERDPKLQEFLPLERADVHQSPAAGAAPVLNSTEIASVKSDGVHAFA